MALAAIVTLLGIAIAVAALAIYLIAVAVILKNVTFTLGTIIAGVRAIDHVTQPTSAVVSDINGNLEHIASAVRERLTARLKADKEPDAESAKARIEQLLNPSVGVPPR